MKVFRWKIKLPFVKLAPNFWWISNRPLNNLRPKPQNNISWLKTLWSRDLITSVFVEYPPFVILDEYLWSIQICRFHDSAPGNFHRRTYQGSNIRLLLQIRGSRYKIFSLIGITNMMNSASMATGVNISQERTS